ncbi:mismatch repair ATPase MSH2 [Sporobolomyces koalae]|uniref:mismatch repair ATPase MSH2 n=1 Tax=Sporobolomyces koalae TaxID=500713 RepID=UPI003171048B
MPALQYSKEKRKDVASDSDLSLVASIRKLAPTPEGTIRLFDRQDYYQAFSTSAVFVATHHYKTQTVLKYFGHPSPATHEPLGLPAVSLSHAVATSFLRDALTTKQLRIEIYSQEKGTAYKWKLAKEASPGNLSQVEDLLFGAATGQELLASPVIMAIRVKASDKAGTTVGVAFADTSAFELGVSEYTDTDLFSNTESLLIQLGVKEVLLTPEDKANSYDLQKLKQLIERCNIVVTERKKSDFNHKDVEQDLNRLLRGNLQASTLPEFDQTLALSSLAALINYLALLSAPHNFGAFSLKNHDLSMFMKLDASALRALNLMPDPSGLSGSNKTSSVFGLLNRCKTAQGTRTLAMWLKQPSINLHLIRQRQELVHCLIENTEFRQTLADTYLRFFPDFHRISKRFQKQNASLEDVVRVYQAVVLLPGMVTLLENGVVEGGDEVEMAQDGDDPAVKGDQGKSQKEQWKALVEELWLSKVREFSDSLSTYQQMVETTIDLSELSNHNFVIKPEFDDSLVNLRDKLEGIRDSLDQVHREVADDLGFETDGKVLHFEANSLFGYCFRLTRKEAAAIKNKKKYIELKNQTNGVHFTTKALKELVEEFRDVTKEYEKKQSSLVKEVIGIASSYCEVLETLNHILAHIDVITSLATSALAAPIPYIKPTVFEQGQGSLELEEARHPCLEVQDGVNFISNDCKLERDVSEFSIITGPNAGGKSVFIRQTALIALLAQIGSFVPCTSASLPIFDSILCRVGAGDSQLKGVSTFMSEMLETSAILKNATKDSLVIIDELGRGTSTYDGFGLAWAISEHLCTVTRASVLFATHFHELTALAQTVKHVKNLHVVAHVEENPDSLTGKEITLLYKVAQGVCDQSFGIHVAQLANFPEEVVKLAQRKADDLEDFGQDPEETTMSNAMPSEVIAEGTSLVEAFLSDWVARTSKDAIGSESMTLDDEATLDLELEQLKKVYAEWQDKLEASQWVREVLEKTA